MTTLREAAQQALWALQYHVEMTWPIDRTSEAIFNLRAALAQQEAPKGGGNLPPPLQAEPVQEPVVVKDSWGLTLKAGWYDLPIDTKLYAHPPRREWQSLSEEEIDRWTPEIHPVIRAVEAALKEKNA
jgi:hypothetical protein